MSEFARPVQSRTDQSASMPHLSRDQFDWVRRFRTALGEAGMGAKRLLIAVSGGSDSVALLELAVLARGDEGVADLVVCIDHGQRPEAAEEAVFVADFATRLGREALLPQISAQPFADEASLRKLRYQKLRSIAAESGCEFILTGHTRGDQVETVLHRLFRGAGRRGLGAIRARQADLLRPLLGFEREELREFLTGRGTGWREDESNTDERFMRNRIRRRIIPVLNEHFGVGAVRHLAELAPLWAMEEDFLESEASRYAAFAITGSEASSALDGDALSLAPEALRTRVVRRWLAAASGKEPNSFSLDEITAVLAFASSARGTSRIAIAGADVALSHGRITLEPRNAARHVTGLDDAFHYEIMTAEDASVTGSDGWTIALELCPETAPAAARANLESSPNAHNLHYDFLEWDASLLPPVLTIRPAFPGDRMKTAGGGPRNVSDVMSDAQLPPSERGRWPLLTGAGAVLWVPGVAADTRFAATEASAERVRLCWRRRPLA